MKDVVEGGEVLVMYGVNVIIMDGVFNFEGVSVGVDGNLVFVEGSDRDVIDG